jgi:tight adherence protein C
MDFSNIIILLAAVAAGISVTCIALLLFFFMESIEVDKEIGDETRKTLPILIKIFMPFAPNLRFIARRQFFHSATHYTEDHLMMAGYSSAISAEDFIAVRALLTILGFGVFVMCITTGNVILGFVLMVCLYVYPGAWLKTIVKKRHLEIMKNLPNVLDLLTLSVEAGKDFLTSLRDILNRRKMDALGEELGRTFKEIQLGKKRQVALRDLSIRVKQPDLTAVLNAIIQAEELGVSIGNLLKIQGDMLRNKRFVRAEKLANEAPVKILFPMVVFIFPSVFIILMVPILMQAFKFIAR